MMVIASTWLGISILMCIFAWFAARWLALALPLAVAAAALAIYIPTGSPRFTTPPPGKYTVLGAKIVPDVGIWVLLDDGASEPRYYRLQYSTSQANELQGAQDAGQGQPGSVKMEVGQDGGTRYDGPPPVTGEPPKAPEQPALTIP
ncbi:hypothetical protein [Mesorhizobium caraganae]|uniref:hypothetical protein n=1 Tax=Mesorhizobium caraganae TaxID=483206 RepID=UPI0017801FF7|nr:hypothetical protein [Mesorhizobium caraganae]